MKWISVKTRLPDTYKRVLVCRIIKIMDCELQTHEIGYLDRAGGYDRWRLDSQVFSPLPLCPTLDSGIITHWMPLPKLPPKKEDTK